MRRVLTILTASLLVLVSLGIGVLTADLPFWRRALQLPLAADATYLPVAVLGDAAAEGQREPVAAVPVRHSAAVRPPGDGVPAADADDLMLDPSVLEPGSDSTRPAEVRALLVMHRGRMILERYFLADDAGTLMPADLIARPLAAMAVGMALAEGHIGSLDAPVSTWLTEWSDDARGRITVRQLLEETSGLETGGEIRGLLRHSPLDAPRTLPRFATSRGVRMLLGNDYESGALAFRLAHEPGGFRDVSPANPQLTAVIIERASGEPYERYLDRRLWRPMGAARAELQLDRRAGMPAAHCCWRATARDMLAVAALLASDGRKGTNQLLPAEWVRQMAQPSRVSAQTGLHLNLVQLDGAPVLEAMEEGGAFWALPGSEIAILAVRSAGPPAPAGDDRLRALAGRVIAAVVGGQQRK
jgi:CubicO group peptidase (beta-lactamase class C family)